ncbi:MAG: DUF4476 domain-containing protein, partial [Cyclobacteriaceae bacterium]|nr:DUF4476 domain-containing protein [Cyclobacteriaceae bacterium]
NKGNNSQSGKVSGSIQTEEGNADIQVTVSQNSMSMNMQIPAEKSEQKAKKEPAVNKVPQVEDGLMCNSPTVDGQILLKFKYKISSVNMEVYKTKDIKDFMNNNCMLASQVADLVKIIQMNDYQYDVAQLGYLRTYDQANYQVVVDALMADYNKEKLLNFISSNSTNVNVSTVPSTYGVKKTNNEVIKEEASLPASQPSVNTYRGTSGASTCIPMNEVDFDEALQAVDEPINEDNKMEVAKSVFHTECLNTNQIYKVMNLFIDENRKLDFAKFAFSRTSEKDKYFRLNKAFISEDRITELSSFVKNNR